MVESLMCSLRLGERPAFCIVSSNTCTSTLNRIVCGCTFGTIKANGGYQTSLRSTAWCGDRGAIGQSSPGGCGLGSAVLGCSLGIPGTAAAAAATPPIGGVRTSARLKPPIEPKTPRSIGAFSMGIPNHQRRAQAG